jgi:hypothetical protein
VRAHPSDPAELPGRHEAPSRRLFVCLIGPITTGIQLAPVRRAALVTCWIFIAVIAVLTVRAAAADAAPPRPPASTVPACARAVAAADQVLEQAGLIGGDIDLVHVADALDAYRAVAATCKTSQPPR